MENVIKNNNQTPVNTSTRMQMERWMVALVDAIDFHFNIAQFYHHWNKNALHVVATVGVPLQNLRCCGQPTILSKNAIAVAASANFDRSLRDTTKLSWRESSSVYSTTKQKSPSPSSPLLPLPLHPPFPPPPLSPRPPFPPCDTLPYVNMQRQTAAAAAMLVSAASAAVALLQKFDKRLLLRLWPVCTPRVEAALRHPRGRVRPTKLLKDVIAVAASTYHTCAIMEGPRNSHCI